MIERNEMIQAIIDMDLDTFTRYNFCFRYSRDYIKKKLIKTKPLVRMIECGIEKTEAINRIK